MADEVNALAQEYFDYLLTAWPTWGHMMGNYEHTPLYRMWDVISYEDEFRGFLNAYEVAYDERYVWD